MNEFQFTCVSFDSLELLIPRDYITAAFYMEALEEKMNIVYNEETLPHLNVSQIILNKFKCSSHGQSDCTLIINASDWEDDTCRKISEWTSTDFPKSGKFALSFNTEIYNQIIKINEFSIFPGAIKKHLQKRGILAVRFSNNKSQFLVALDFIIGEFLKEKFFSDTGEKL